MLSMLLATSSGTLLKLKRIRLVDFEEYSDVSILKNIQMCPGLC